MMCKDGPAAGLVLTLQRAPKFLRVVLNRDGKWDALDQLDDTPEDDEQLFAYELRGDVTRGFIDGAKYSGPFASGLYHVVAEQPTDAQMRTLETWRAWCVARVPFPIVPCRSCHADIVWLKTKAGKAMPVDAATVKPGSGDTYDAKAGHVSHFATCVNAAKHRKPR